MAITIHKSTPMAAPRIVVFGPPGVGKTHWAVGGPSPIVLAFEDGLGTLDVPAITSDGKRTIGSVEDLEAAIEFLITGDHAFRTVVVDSLTAMQALMADDVAREEGKKAIDEIAYGRGWGSLAPRWGRVLRGLDAIRARGVAVVCIAHATVSTFEDPETSAFERTEMRLQHSKNVSIRAMTREWADGVYFADFKRHVAKIGKGADERVRAIDGKGERVLRTKPAAARDGKDRYGLPPELPLDWASFGKAYHAAIAPRTQQPETITENES